WERSREGRAAATIHEPGDLAATRYEALFREKRSGRETANERGVDRDAGGGRARGSPGDEEGGPGSGDGDHGRHAERAGGGGPERGHGRGHQDLSLPDARRRVPEH